MIDKLHKEEWYVANASLEQAQQMVQEYHYAKGGSNTRVYVHGLYRKEDDSLHGIAWWLPPTKSCGLATFPENGQGVLSLSRLVLRPDVPTNGASFLMASSRKLIDRERWPCLVTYADTWRGHTGAIYKADNWDYVGMTKPQRVYTIDGRMVARKAGPRTRTHAEMIEMGAICLGYFSKHKFVMMPPRSYYRKSKNIARNQDLFAA